MAFQFVKRAFASGYVFYPYHKDVWTHPFFQRYFQTPSASYVNFPKAAVCHYVSSVPRGAKWLTKPFVLEPQDHPLAPGGCSEPFLALRSKKFVENIYEHPNCRAIIVDGEPFKELFSRYFDRTTRKTVIVPIGSVPVSRIKFHDADLVRSQTLETINVVCLASDFYSKGLDILLTAWLSSRIKDNGALHIACPNIPQKWLSIIENSGVRLTQKAPLSVNEKLAFHKAAHLAIGLLHTDGGSNIIEAFEYGVPVVTTATHRSLVSRDSGWVLNVPFYFYEPTMYGVQWATAGDFIAMLQEAKRAGEFDSTITDLVEVFDSIASSPSLLTSKGRVAYELACGEHSLARRNRILGDLYAEIR